MKNVRFENDSMYIENDAGIVLTLGNEEAFHRYTGFYFPNDIIRASYIPGQNFYMVDYPDGSTLNRQIPDPFYETLMDNVALYSARFDDRLYGLPPQEEKDLGFTDIKGLILNATTSACMEPLAFGGHTFDLHDFQIPYAYTLALGLVVKGTPLSEPMPDGKWPTLDKNLDGVTIQYAPLTIGEFIDMVELGFKRVVDNISVREFHYRAVEAMYLDPTKDGYDLMGYDYSAHWNSGPQPYPA